MTNDSPGQNGSTSIERLIEELNNRMWVMDAAFQGLDDQDKIIAYVHALSSLVNTLGKFPGITTRMFTLMDLTLRLEEVSLGSNSLRPNSHTTRAKSSFREANYQGLAVAAVEILMRNGETSNEARKYVAEQLASEPIRGRQGKRIGISTVTKWRTDIVRDKDWEGLLEVGELKVRDLANRQGAYVGDKKDARLVYLATLMKFQKHHPGAAMSKSAVRKLLKSLLDFSNPPFNVLAKPYLS